MLVGRTRHELVSTFAQEQAKKHRLTMDLLNDGTTTTSVAFSDFERIKVEETEMLFLLVQPATVELRHVRMTDWIDTWWKLLLFLLHCFQTTDQVYRIDLYS